MQTQSSAQFAAVAAAIDASGQILDNDHIQAIVHVHPLPKRPTDSPAIMAAGANDIIWE